MIFGIFNFIIKYVLTLKTKNTIWRKYLLRAKSLLKIKSRESDLFENHKAVIFLLKLTKLYIKTLREIV